MSQVTGIIALTQINFSVDPKPDIANKLLTATASFAWRRAHYPLED
jgi:hypothetical protein